MKTIIRIFLWLTVLVGLVSCHNSEGKVEYIPFQKTSGGWWSMIRVDGKVLFEDQFKQAPTVGREGYFLAQNKDGFWQYFTTSGVPRSDGKQYVFATLFENGRALAVEPNQEVTIINRSFDVVKVLDQFGGAKVTQVRPFKDGYAVVQCGEKYGVCDRDGNPVIMPVYFDIQNRGHGMFLGLPTKIDEHTDYNTLSWDIVDANQGKTGTMPYTYAWYNNDLIREGDYNDDVLIVSKSVNKETCAALVGKQGQTIVEASPTNMRIMQEHDGLFSYFDNKAKACGVRRLTGEQVLPATYGLTGILAKDLLVCYPGGDSIQNTQMVMGSDSTMVGATLTASDSKHGFVTDLQGQVMGPVKALKILPFYRFRGEKTALAQLETDSWGLVSRDGELLEDLPVMCNVSLNEGSPTLKSDYVDMAQVLNAMQISENGCGGLTLGTSPRSAVNILNCWSTSPESFRGSSRLENYSTSFANIDGRLSIYFNGSMSHDSYTSQTYWYYDWWYGYYPQTYRQYNGIKWSSPGVRGVTVAFINDSNLHGKLLRLKNAIADKLRSMGTASYDQTAITYVNFTSGGQGAVYMLENEVVLVIGKLKSPSEIDLTQMTDHERPYDSSKDVDYGYSLLR